MAKLLRSCATRACVTAFASALVAAAGLVPFACKLPAPLAATLREKSAGRADGINGLVAELLQKALK